MKPLHVIVLNWNGKAVIRECLSSLGEVEYEPMRVTVVDNASTDRSPDIVESEFPGVELIKNSDNLLYAGGNNVGLKKALQGEGDLFLLLNNDTVVDRRFAGFMAEALEMEGAGIAGPKILYHDDPGRIWYGGGGFYPVLGIPKHLDIRKADEDESEEIVETGYVTGCAMMVRREVFEDIGLLDTEYGIYCEDVDFCLRAKAAGWKCYYVPRARIDHKVSSSSGGGFTPFKMENRVVSTERLFKKHRSTAWRISVFPAHMAVVSILAVSLFFTGRLSLLKGLAKGVWRVLKRGKNLK